MPSRRAQPLFTFRLVPLVGALLREQGVDPLALLREADLPVEALKAPEVTAPLAAFRTLLARAAEATGDDAFGLTLAERVPDGTYSLLEFVARSAQTLRDAFVSLARYGALVNAVTRFGYDESTRGGAFTHFTLAPGATQGRELHEFTLGRVLAIAQQQVGEDFRPLEAWFSSPKPKRTERLVARFGPRLRFAAKDSGMLIAPRELDLKLSAADPALAKWLERQADEALQRMPGSSDLSGRVRAVLTEGLPRGNSDVRHVARALELTERTLQRKLATEGHTFAGLLEEVRRALAQRYLDDPRLSVSEIAFLLGYSELRAFDRAFLRWTKQTPNAWRKALRAESRR
jgi:AraC-like DNA-binding protein